MKILLRISLLLITTISCTSQNKNTKKLDLVFLDECNGQIIEPEYEIEDFPEFNYKLITVFVKRGDLIGHFITTLENHSDTLRVPKILFAFDSKNQSKSKRQLSMNCDQVCNGIETQYYQNGNIKMKGNFKNGNPVEIKSYRENGLLVTQAFYKKSSFDFTKVNYYNENEDLETYQLYQYKRKKTIIETYDVNGKLIETEERASLK